MTETIETISPEESVVQAANRLFESRSGLVLVDGDSGPPAGIITETDFVELVATDRDLTAVTVTDCMSSPVITLSTVNTLEDAAELMTERNIKKVPVTENGAHRIVGAVTTREMAKYLPVRDFHPER